MENAAFAFHGWTPRIENQENQSELRRKNNENPKVLLLVLYGGKRSIWIPRMNSADGEPREPTATDDPEPGASPRSWSGCEHHLTAIVAGIFRKSRIFSYFKKNVFLAVRNPLGMMYVKYEVQETILEVWKKNTLKFFCPKH